LINVNPTVSYGLLAYFKAEKQGRMAYWGRIIAAATATIALAAISYYHFPLGVLFPIAILLMIYSEWSSRTPKL